MADVGRGEVRDLGSGVGGGDAAGGKGEVLLEPEEFGGDGGAEVCGCVDSDGYEGAVEGEWGAESWGF